MIDLSILTGKKILEEKDSPINGKIRVVKDLAWGVHIQAEGLTQSGGVVENIWRSTLKRIYKAQFTINNCLILGLGGGTAAKIIRKMWPECRITGIDIDPVMVEMGKKYLGLDKSEVQVKIQDAGKFVAKSSKLQAKSYDLIIIDLYQGDKYPKEFEWPVFLRFVHRLITKNGCAVFNRLYFANKRPEAMKFGKKLEKVFIKVEYFHPQANLMFICQK